MSSKNVKRKKRAIRSKVRMIHENSRPRVVVYRSLKHVYVQLVNDQDRKVLCSSSTLCSNVRSVLKKDTTKTEASYLVGKDMAEKVLSLNVKEISFDRNGYLYHGRVKSLADALREGGLKF